MAGGDIGPAALRVARLNQRIARLGYSVRDLGDMRLERPQVFPEEHEKLKYVREISTACEQLPGGRARRRLCRSGRGAAGPSGPTARPGGPGASPDKAASESGSSPPCRARATSATRAFSPPLKTRSNTPPRV